MNHWIITCTRKKTDSGTVAAREVYSTRMKESFWGLAEKTPNRSNLQEGDKVVFYVGLPDIVFAGAATLASSSFHLTDEQRRKYCREGTVYQTDYGVKLADIEIWDPPRGVKELVPDLGFIENKEFWYSYLQGGVRGITEEAYEIIVGERTAPELSLRGEAPDVSSVSEFALEAHLEEFLHANWGKVPWGRKIRQYETPDSDGRQFPAATWSIDFLAIDEDSQDFVVIELKRGQTSDATVGQVLRYMSWVRENLVGEGQGVRGLIICRQVDEALRLAVKGLPGVAILTYEVDFKLKELET